MAKQIWILAKGPFAVEASEGARTNLARAALAGATKNENKTTSSLVPRLSTQQ